MSQYALVLRKNGVDQTTYLVGPEGLSIGRASECSITLADSLVSRKHARVWLKGDELQVTDLDSRNGVYVNGRRVDTCALSVDDEVVFGNHFFVVTRPVVKDLMPDTSTMCTTERADAVHQQIVQEEGDSRLPILYKASQLMGSVFSLDELLGQVLDLLGEALPMERGYVLIVSPDTGEPEVRASFPSGGDTENLPLSQTLIQHVFSQRSGVLTMNAQQDARFDGSESVLGHEIRAAMCAPLFGRDSLVGAMYVDSGKKSALFSNNDLELLTVMGRVVGVAIENAHLHQEKMASERLAAIGQATAGIGHCVKNILVGIKGGGEFIDMGLERNDWKWVRKGWPLVRRSVERIEDLVLNLMLCSHDKKPTLEPTRLEYLVTEVLEVTRTRAEKGRVRVEFRDGDIGTVYVDGRDLFRVILNLTTNAIEACEEAGGAVVITTSRDARGCYIEVSDDGPGVDASIRDTLFQAFVSTKGSKGTGLGLACSERIVRAHGGVIWLESAPGKGSTFTVFLPSQTLTSPGALIPATEETTESPD